MQITLDVSHLSANNSSWIHLFVRLRLMNTFVHRLTHKQWFFFISSLLTRIWILYKLHTSYSEHRSRLTGSTEIHNNYIIGLNRIKNNHNFAIVEQILYTYIMNTKILYFNSSVLMHCNPWLLASIIICSAVDPTAPQTPSLAW